MKKLYPEVENLTDEYRRIFLELKPLIPIENNIILEMSRIWEEGKESNFTNVYGYDPTLPDDVITKGIAIEFRPWQKWLEYQIGIGAKEE